jgi:hypothetical protein
MPLDASIGPVSLKAECDVCLVRRACIARIPCAHTRVCSSCLHVLRDAEAACPMRRRQIAAFPDAIQFLNVNIPE